MHAPNVTGGCNIIALTLTRQGNKPSQAKPSKRDPFVGHVTPATPQRHSLDATSKESGARGRRARGDGDGLHALAQIHVRQVVPHVFGVAAHAPVEVAAPALALVVTAEALS